jgi:hypothetical protein
MLVLVTDVRLHNWEIVVLIVRADRYFSWFNSIVITIFKVLETKLVRSKPTPSPHGGNFQRPPQNEVTDDS